MAEAQKQKPVTRRDFVRNGFLGACLVALAALFGTLTRRIRRPATVWQIDPYKCVACGNCATYCVLEESAVKCVHAFALCGYCDICTGFFELSAPEWRPGAEFELCPAGAIQRTYIEGPHYEYTIDESRCIACGKCVKGCNAFGNGSLFLQVRHDRCLHCNECSIARACSAGAYRRVPADHPYQLKMKRVKDEGGNT